MEIDLATKAHPQSDGALSASRLHPRAVPGQRRHPALRPGAFDPEEHPRRARAVLPLRARQEPDANPPQPLGTKCSEGPAVSRKRMHIAWTHVAARVSRRDARRQLRACRRRTSFIEDGTPKLANQKLIIDSRDLPFQCTLETQNFRPPDEKELTFSAYGYQGTDVCGIDLATKKVVELFQLARPIRRAGGDLSRRPIHAGRVRQAESSRAPATSTSGS